MCQALVYSGEQDRLGSCHSGVEHPVEQRDDESDIKNEKKDNVSSNDCQDGSK